MSVLVATIAKAACGKSTWLAGRFSRYQIVNLDDLRGVVSDDQGDQEATGDAVDIQDRILAARCRRRRLTAVDATNLGLDIQRKLISLAVTNMMMPVAVVFDVPLETCKEWNERRRREGGRYVPPAAIERQHQHFLRNVPPTGPVPGFAQTVRIGVNGGRTVYTLVEPNPDEPQPWLA